MTIYCREKVTGTNLHVSASLKVHTPEDSATTTQSTNFIVVDKFVPATKLELQVLF